jgi:hypothetical protein
MKKLTQKSINKIIFYKLFENDTLPQVQPQIDTKTNTQMSNDSFITSVPTNNTSVKNNLKRASGNPPRAEGDDEMDDYYRWVDKQMDKWEKDNPRPEWVDGMSEEEWRALMMEWEWYYNEHRYGLQHWYAWNFPGTNGTFPGQIPQRNPLPQPREPNETSPKPPVVLPYPGIISPWLQHNDGPERGYWDDDWVQGREWA